MSDDRPAVLFEAMAEVGIDIASQSPKLWTDESKTRVEHLIISLENL